MHPDAIGADDQPAHRVLAETNLGIGCFESGPGSGRGSSGLLAARGGAAACWAALALAATLDAAATAPIF